MTGRETVLKLAREAVLSDRNAAYGPPEDNFRDIAQLWATFLKGRDGETINAVDVAAMLILMKVARMRATPTKLDHWVDAAGYAACGADCFPKEATPNLDLFVAALEEEEPWCDHCGAPSWDTCKGAPGCAEEVPF
jgi:hypothetical protein